jgi:hypothetical protein
VSAPKNGQSIPRQATGGQDGSALSGAAGRPALTGRPGTRAGGRFLTGSTAVPATVTAQCISAWPGVSHQGAPPLFLSRDNDAT